MVKTFFDQPINNDVKTYENIRKIATGQGDDYTTDCLLDYPYFKENQKMISIDLSQQQALDADPRPIQQIKFAANYYSNVFLSKKQKKLRLFARNCKIFINVLQNAISLNNLIFINIKWLNIIA